MKFDIKANLISTKAVPNGMGGYTPEETVSSEISIFTTPVKAEIMLKEHGVVSTTSLKVFTKDAVPDENLRVVFNGKKFKQLQLADFGKIRMMLVEEITNE